MTHIDARPAHAQSALQWRSQQRSPKHGGDPQANTGGRAVHLLDVHAHQATTETSERTDDERGRWTDDGGQNNTTLLDGT